jgi:hypothetical protein
VVRFCPTLTKIELIKEAKAKLKEPETQKMAQDLARSQPHPEYFDKKFS